MTPSVGTVKKLILPALLILTISSVCSAAGVTKEDTFWTWFKTNAKRLYHRETAPDPAALDRELQEAIKAVNPVLSGVIDGIRDDGRRIFIISCGAEKKGIPAVRALYRKMPYMNSFRVVTFLPGRIVMRDREYNGITAKAREARFLLFGEEVDMQVKALLLFPGYTPERERDYRELARLFLIDAIGEWETMTKIRTVMVGPLDSPYAREAWPVQAMPTRFNLYWYALRHPGR